MFVDIPRGTSTDGIAEMLANAGVVRSRYDFLLARLTERGRVLKAGEYRFNHPASPIEVFDRIARGDVFAFELVVPEGKNMFDIAAAAEQLKLFSAADFLKAARDPGDDPRSRPAGARRSRVTCSPTRTRSAATPRRSISAGP